MSSFHRDDSKLKKKIEADFAEVHTRLSQLERTYNPRDENLHFEPVVRADADLYSGLLQLAQEGLAKVRQQHSYFSNPRHRLYDDGMFWYNLCLLIKAAAVRVEVDKAQNAITSTVVNALTEVVVEVSEYTGDGDDMYKRNYETLGETLLTFYSDDLVALARQKSHVVGTKSVGFVDETISRVNEIRQHKG